MIVVYVRLLLVRERFCEMLEHGRQGIKHSLYGLLAYFLALKFTCAYKITANKDYHETLFTMHVSISLYFLTSLKAKILVKSLTKFLHRFLQSGT